MGRESKMFVLETYGSDVHCSFTARVDARGTSLLVESKKGKNVFVFSNKQNPSKARIGVAVGWTTRNGFELKWKVDFFYVWPWRIVTPVWLRSCVSIDYNLVTVCCTCIDTALAAASSRNTHRMGRGKEEATSVEHRQSQWQQTLTTTGIKQQWILILNPSRTRATPTSHRKSCPHCKPFGTT